MILCIRPVAVNTRVLTLSFAQSRSDNCGSGSRDSVAIFGNYTAAVPLERASFEFVHANKTNWRACRYSLKRILMHARLEGRFRDLRYTCTRRSPRNTADDAADDDDDDDSSSRRNYKRLVALVTSGERLKSSGTRRTLLFRRPSDSNRVISFPRLGRYSTGAERSR
jgi:hypothetical protein